MENIHSMYNMENIDQIPAYDLELNINDQLFLEVLLMEIKEETIRFTKERNKNNKQRENNLAKGIQNLKRELSEFKDTDTINLLENIDEKKGTGRDNPGKKLKVSC